MFVWDEVYEGGMEWSNEEIRAKKMVWGGSGSGSPIQEWEMEWHGPEGEPNRHKAKLKRWRILLTNKLYR